MALFTDGRMRAEEKEFSAGFVLSYRTRDTSSSSSFLVPAMTRYTPRFADEARPEGSGLSGRLVPLEARNVHNLASARSASL